MITMSRVDSKTFLIRRAIQHDAESIHAIQMRAFAEEGRLSGTSDIPPLLEPLSAILDHIRTQTVLVAVEGDRIVGAVRGLLDGTDCTIRGLIVDPEKQNKGIGSHLFRSIEDAHPDVHRFCLTTNTLVPGNVSFYERRGYRVSELVQFTDQIVVANMTKLVHSPN